MRRDWINQIVIFCDTQKNLGFPRFFRVGPFPAGVSSRRPYCRSDVSWKRSSTFGAEPCSFSLSGRCPPGVFPSTCLGSKNLYNLKVISGFHPPSVRLEYQEGLIMF